MEYGLDKTRQKYMIIDRPKIGLVYSQNKQNCYPIYQRVNGLPDYI
jgi:hypothetical protein